MTGYYAWLLEHANRSRPGLGVAFTGVAFGALILGGLILLKLLGGTVRKERHSASLTTCVAA